MAKINFGSNRKHMDGFTNVDALDLDGVDLVHDCNNFPYPFKDNSVEEIVAIEFLEHLSMDIGQRFLKECWRILAPDGKLQIQVPACDKMFEFFVNKQVADVIPHKATHAIHAEDILALQKSTGKMVNPVRFEFAFNGAQKHDFDYHLNFFTKKKLYDYLFNAGFVACKIQYDKFNWKLLAEAIK